MTGVREEVRGQRVAGPRHIASALSNLDNVLVVGSLDLDADGLGVLRANHSNYGPPVHLGAPGVSVLVWLQKVAFEERLIGLRGSTLLYATAPRLVDSLGGTSQPRWCPPYFGPRYSRYSTDDGTSFAAPIVAAAAGLVRSLNPDLDAPATKRLLLDTAEPVDVPGLGDRMVNFTRAATRSILQRLEARPDPRKNRLLSFRTTGLMMDCSDPANAPVEPEQGADCVPLRQAADGTLEGGRAPEGPDDPLGFELRDAQVVPGPDGSEIHFTIHGNFASPGIGPATTVYTGRLRRPEPEMIGGLWRIEGSLDGEAELRDADGGLQQRCTWFGDFRGSLYED